jgi:histidinol dehydrogenase
MQKFDGYQSSRAALENANAARDFSAATEIAGNVEKRVREICEAVRAEGDAALLRLEREYSCPDLTAETLRVTPQEIESAWRSTPVRVRAALERAAKNIEAFHAAQPRESWMMISPDGANLGQRYSALERVALYAPCGRAAYPSTVLMLAIPAKVAGVSQIVLATPSGKDGNAHPLILAAAHICGLREIYKIGGAQGMAALAYGTDAIPRVDKLVGPGSIYVTLAKKFLYGTVGIDGLFGPSEVVVFADDSPANRPAQLAADLIAQAEHGEDSFVCFVCLSQNLCNAVLREIESQLASSPRAEYLRKSLENSLACVVSTPGEAVELCNLAAAEHVEIWSGNAEEISKRVQNAGAIFLNTPVPLGDYILGPSHTLPTGASARFASGVAVDTFLKRSTIVSAPRETLVALADDLSVLANLEELPGHANAAQMAISEN